MIDQSPEDVERKHLRVLGPRLGPVFHGLYEEVAWLQDKWREFRELFGTSPQRIGLLEEAAGRFFGQVQNALWEDTLLHLSRLTDAPKIGGKSNLSVQQLPDLIDDPALKGRVQLLVAQAVEKSAFARDWRNRFIAHRDLPQAVETPPQQLAFASRALVQEAIDALTAIVCTLYERFFGGGLDLRVPGGPGDALDLLVVLQDGLSAARARDAGLTRGQPLPEDLIPRPAI